MFIGDGDHGAGELAPMIHDEGPGTNCRGYVDGRITGTRPLLREGASSRWAAGNRTHAPGPQPGRPDRDLQASRVASRSCSVLGRRASPWGRRSTDVRGHRAPTGREVAHSQLPRPTVSSQSHGQPWAENACRECLTRRARTSPACPHPSCTSHRSRPPRSARTEGVAWFRRWYQISGPIQPGSAAVAIPNHAVKISSIAWP